VTPSFFELFAFRWLQGSPQTSLSQPGQVVIDEEMARKYFKGNALGRRVRLDNEHDLVVSGVIAKMPANTDFPIQFAVSHRTFERTKGYEATYRGGSNSSYQSFVLLKENADPAALEKKFPAMVARHLGREEAEKYIAHALQPLSRVHFEEKPGRTNFSKRSVAESSLTGLAWIGAFLLLTACINFINLATAQATKRAKEVGIRKVLGSTRGQLMGQFMGETLLLTLAAVVLSLLLTHQAVHLLNDYLDIPLDFAAVLTPGHLLALAGAGAAVGLVAGVYPSLVLSAFEPVHTLKNTLSGGSPGSNRLRKGLVAFQFGIAQLMIICTVVVASQMHHVNNTSLGFDKEAVVMVDLPESDPQKLEALRSQLSQYAAIRALSFSLNPPAATINKWWNDVTHVSAPDEQIHVEQKFIDEHYLPVYNIRLAAGRNVRPTDTTQILVNEALLRKINIPNPEAALGQQLSYWGREVTIVGVVRDFHNLSLHQQIPATILWRNPPFFQKASFKIEMSQAPEAVAQIERHWKAAFPNYYFSHKFLDDDLATLYEKERKTARLLALFAGLAIFIGCLGLYGLVRFNTARRTKEVGIRKVLGASVAHIVYLFTRDFVRLLALAFLAAAPLGYYLMQAWLSDFTYQVSLAWWMFALAGGLAAAIALLTMSFQSVRAALANPVTSLRNE
jgi:ABC-type lipoprotein release transport system permease subunit